MLEHGGALRAAAVRYGIALDDWLDLSTGINPQGWPVQDLPAAVWRRLPEEGDGLERAAANYYGSQQLLPVAGTQAAIQAVPALRESSRVGVLSPSYGEHAYSWRRHGHRVRQLPLEHLEPAIEELEVLVLINPNNPTGACFAPDRLLDWRARLAKRGGWLVVDEAFMDATPEGSLAAHAGLSGLIILRSLGKFFGLAGARVGFVLGEAELRQRLREYLGPWTLNGPGRLVAARALADRNWQQRTLERLSEASARLAALLNRHGLAVVGGTVLFQWVLHEQAAHIQDAMARRGILVRYFGNPPSLRLGLPGAEASWWRLERALVEVGTEYGAGTKC